MLAGGKLFVNMLKVNFEEENGVMVFTRIGFKAHMAVKVGRQWEEVHAWGAE